MLVGVCVPYVSKEWYQQEIASNIEKDNDNIEIRIENACQQDCIGRVVVVHVTMDKEEEISGKMTNEYNKNDLGIKFVSFKWTSARGIMNAMRMNYHKKEDLRFEILKRIRIDDTVEHRNDLSSVKEMLRNV